MSVYRERNKWRYDFWKKGVRHRQAGFRTKLEAKMAEAESRKNLKVINTDFIGLCERRLSNLEAKRSKKYYKENLRLFKKLTMRWGDKKDITKIDVEDYLNEVAKQSTRQAGMRLRLIKALFNYGKKSQLISHNPTDGVEPYAKEKVSVYIPTEEDIKKVLSVASDKDRLYLLVIIHTLSRISSINNLRWEDIHDDYLTLYTRKAKNSDLKKIVIPLNQVLKETLARIERKGGYVFINPTTRKPYQYRSKLMKGLCKKAKVTPFGFHAFRHFGASLLDNKGVALSTIQKLLGHERPSTTDLYIQSLRGSTIEALKELEGLK